MGGAWHLRLAVLFWDGKRLFPGKLSSIPHLHQHQGSGAQYT